MKKPKISVIVPCYNVELYLEKCLNSLINQTYKNIEIICVEDCSTDNTKNILKKYDAIKNIKIIYNSKNSGLSYSRNHGLSIANGEYIGFIDSDDYIDLNFYECLINKMLEEKSEIGICDIKVVDSNKQTEILSKCCPDEKFTLVDIVNNGLVASACNKLFKKDIFKYQFAEGKVNEDIAVVIPLLCLAKKISYVNNCYYYYVQRNSSIQNSSFSFKRFDIFEAVDLTLERIKNHKQYDILKEAIIYNQIIVLLIYVIVKEKNKKKRYNILKKYNELSLKYNIRQNHYFWQFLENCGSKHKLYYRLLFKANCTGHYFLANNLISCYDLLSKFLKKRAVIPNKITINDLGLLGLRQKQMPDSKIKISVIVPNYNYSKFLYQRLYSILYQNYKIYELIILDDSSKDNSREVIDNIVNKLEKHIKIIKIYNDENSGSAFKQWEKGISYATGDYIWIAEADDYCEPNLLSNLVKPIKKNNQIMISYADTAFIDTVGNIILKSIKSEIDIQKSGHWNKNYTNRGIDEIKNYSFLNCTIANVSSCIIKNENYNSYLKMSGEFKQAGDWLFYLNVIAKGYISYNKKVLNYYRVHGNNVSSTMNKKRHLEEIKKIHKYCIDNFNLNKWHVTKMNERIKFLKKCWDVK